jgi:bacterioferritin-associated ferredoxin
MINERNDAFRARSCEDCGWRGMLHCSISAWGPIVERLSQAKQANHAPKTRRSLELLEKTAFSFASEPRHQYRWRQHYLRVCPPSMIVCSCNVLSDHDVRAAVSAAADTLPRTPGQVYRCLGCSAECGRCARTIKKILDEALGACAKACCSGCPHSQTHADAQAHDPIDPALVEAARRVLEIF